MIDHTSTQYLKYIYIYIKLSQFHHHYTYIHIYIILFPLRGVGQFIY